MSAITLTKLYDLLSEKVGKETAQNLTTYIEEKIGEELNEKAKVLVTSNDLNKVHLSLKDEINAFRVDVEKGFRQQFWLLIVLLIPLYLTLIGFIFTFLNQR